MKATVSSWNEPRGFGFITPKDGSDDIFVHMSDLKDGLTKLNIGDEVDCEVQPSPTDTNPNRKRAANVKRTKEARNTETGRAASAATRGTETNLVGVLKSVADIVRMVRELHGDTARDHKAVLDLAFKAVDELEAQLKLERDVAKTHEGEARTTQVRQLEQGLTDLRSALADAQSQRDDALVNFEVAVSERDAAQLERDIAVAEQTLLASVAEREAKVELRAARAEGAKARSAGRAEETIARGEAELRRGKGAADRGLGQLFTQFGQAQAIEAPGNADKASGEGFKSVLEGQGMGQLLTQFGQAQVIEAEATLAANQEALLLATIAIPRNAADAANRVIERFDPNLTGDTPEMVRARAEAARMIHEAVVHPAGAFGRTMREIYSHITGRGVFKAAFALALLIVVFSLFGCGNGREAIVAQMDAARAAQLDSDTVRVHAEMVKETAQAAAQLSKDSMGFETDTLIIKRLFSRDSMRILHCPNCGVQQAAVVPMIAVPLPGQPKPGSSTVAPQAKPVVASTQLTTTYRCKGSTQTDCSGGRWMLEDAKGPGSSFQIVRAQPTGVAVKWNFTCPNPCAAFPVTILLERNFGSTWMEVAPRGHYYVECVAGYNGWGVEYVFNPDQTFTGLIPGKYRTRLLIADGRDYPGSQAPFTIAP